MPQEKVDKVEVRLGECGDNVVYVLVNGKIVIDGLSPESTVAFAAELVKYAHMTSLRIEAEKQNGLELPKVD